MENSSPERLTTQDRKVNKDLDRDDRDVPDSDALVPDHGHFNASDVLRGSAVNEPTIFERKAALVNLYVVL